MTSKRQPKTALFEKAVGSLRLASDRDYKVLDFGCGTGEFLDLLSRSVGTASDFVGYDAMEKSIDQAKARYPDMTFICDKFVDQLPFPDAAFDILVTIDAIECVKDKEALIHEFHRVMKPGGQVLAMHWDWDTQAYNIADRELARQAVIAFSDWKQSWMDEADGQMGRKLWGLFEGSGRFQGRPGAFCLTETTYEPGNYGYDRARDLSVLAEQGGFNKEKYAQFCQELSKSSTDGTYFYNVVSFLYHGMRA